MEKSPRCKILQIETFALTFIKYTDRLFLRFNDENELYLSIMSFQIEANRVCVSEINIVVFKWQS